MFQSWVNVINCRVNTRHSDRQCSVMVINTSHRARPLGSKACSFLCLSFFICKMGMIVVPPAQRACGFQMSARGKVWSHCLPRECAVMFVTSSLLFIQIVLYVFRQHLCRPYVWSRAFWNLWSHRSSMGLRKPTRKLVIGANLAKWYPTLGLEISAYLHLPFILALSEKVPQGKVLTRKS